MFRFLFLINFNYNFGTNFDLQNPVLLWVPFKQNFLAKMKTMPIFLSILLINHLKIEAKSFHEWLPPELFGKNKFDKSIKFLS